jgi:large conductance mechanosensitive channel
MLSDFKTFLVKQNILALAIAVVVGAALGALVKAMVDDFIMPIITAGMPAGEWQTAVVEVGPVTFGIGHFAGALVNFLIVAFIAWRITKIFAKPEPVPAAPAMKDCQFCRMTISAAAVRCPHCTSQLAS